MFPELLTRESKVKNLHGGLAQHLASQDVFDDLWVGVGLRINVGDHWDAGSRDSGGSQCLPAQSFLEASLAGLHSRKATDAVRHMCPSPKKTLMDTPPTGWKCCQDLIVIHLDILLKYPAPRCERVNSPTAISVLWLQTLLQIHLTRTCIL